MRTAAHILIVEDSADDREMFAHFLSMCGYRVSKARDGKEGLEKALTLQPDLILTDLWLPALSGWDTMRRLRADTRTRNIPILVVTSHSSVPTRESDGWLTKPCQLDDLGAEVASLLESRGKNRFHRPG
jgi:two-component system, cell cycle response regulator DivK